MHHWFTYPYISPIAFRIGPIFGRGPIEVHWYGLAYLAGFIAVYLWMARPAGRRRLGLNPNEIQDFLVYALVGVLVGGRALFDIADMITCREDISRVQSCHTVAQYFSHPILFIAVWQGGMAFHGGLIGVVIAIALFLRKHPRLKFLVLADEAVVLLPIGIAVTRYVNFINDELWGRICRPDHPWCIVPGDPLLWGSQYRHPSQLYEGIMDLATLPILLLLYRRRPKDGVVGWTWFTLYGVARSVGEIWRSPGILFLGLTGGQLLAVPMIAIGIFGIWWSATRGSRTEETPPTSAA